MVGSVRCRFNKGIGMRLLSVLFLVCSIGYGEVVYGGFGTIAHIADGAGIQVEFTLTNLDDTSSYYTLRCYDDNGNPFSLGDQVGTNSEFWGTLAPHASLSIRTAGNAATAAQGWATILTNGANVAVSTTFRFSMGSLAGAEARFRLIPGEITVSRSLRRNTASAVTGLALVNPSSTDLIAVNVTFRGEDGVVLVADAFTLGAHSIGR